MKFTNPWKLAVIAIALIAVLIHPIMAVYFILFGVMFRVDRFIGFGPQRRVSQRL